MKSVKKVSSKTVAPVYGRIHVWLRHTWVLCKPKFRLSKTVASVYTAHTTGMPAGIPEHRIKRGVAL